MVESTPDNRKKAEHQEGGADRRSLLIGAAALAMGFHGASDAEAATATEDPAKMAVQPGDRLQIIRGELKGEMLRPDLLEQGAKPFECFPMDPVSGVLRKGERLNRMLTLRLDPAELSETTAANAADGVLVYSAVCTHKGCTIKSWMAEKAHMRCHCHLSEFDARSSGDVKSGPAKHQLPMVPLAVDAEGYVFAVSGFTSAPGGKTK